MVQTVEYSWLSHTLQSVMKTHYEFIIEYKTNVI